MTSLQNLFVAKLPRNLTDGDLKQIFNDYNPTNAKVMLDATTGKSKGFGFVLFESEECGRIAYDELNRKHISLHGHAFNLCIFPSKHDGNIANEPSHALYIRNIPRTLSQSSVEDFLRGFGNLAYCAMREDHYGEPVWVVYAEFDSVESARATLNSIHGSKTYFNTSVAILAKYADSAEAKRERRKRREQNNGTAVANSPVCCNSYMPTEQPNSPTQVMQHGSSASSPVTSMYAPASPQHYAPIKDPYWPRYSNNNNNNHHSRNNSQHSLASMAPPPMEIPPGDVFPQQPFLTACFPGPNTHFCECAATGRASPTTPLSYSMCDAPFDQNGGSSTASACAVGPHTNTNTPRRGSTGNVSGTYRHNPYAPVTPVSSANSSAGPNSPISNSVAAYRSSPVPCCHGCYTCGAKTLQSCCEPMLQNQQQQQQHGCSGPSTTTTPSVHVHCGSQSTCIPGTGSPHFSSSCHNGFLAAQHTAAK